MKLEKQTALCADFDKNFEERKKRNYNFHTGTWYYNQLFCTGTNNAGAAGGSGSSAGCHSGTTRATASIASSSSGSSGYSTSSSTSTGTSNSDPFVAPTGTVSRR